MTRFEEGWFSRGRDRAAIDLLATACDHVARGFIRGGLPWSFATWR